MHKSFTGLANYNTALMTFKAINQICPSYLSNWFVLVRNAHGRNTRAAAQNKLTVRHVRNKFDGKTFLNSATKVWNDLPIDLRASESLVTFKTKAKSHFLNN